jgi:hypothetical protein
VVVVVEEDMLVVGVGCSCFRWRGGCHLSWSGGQDCKAGTPCGGQEKEEEVEVEVVVVVEERLSIGHRGRSRNL